MSAPSPREFERQAILMLAHVRRELKDVTRLYRTAYESGYTQARRGTGESRLAFGESNPTLSVLGDPLDKRRPGAAAGARRTCERTARRVVEVENMVGSLVPDLTRALERFDPKETFEQLRYPVSVTQADLEESRAAQRRRADG